MSNKRWMFSIFVDFFTEKQLMTSENYLAQNDTVFNELVF